MKRPALGHVLGYTALTVVLTAGAAHSLAGSNTVTSDDIVDGTIVANDIKTAAIGGRPIVDNSITGADVNESTLALPVGQAVSADTIIPPGSYLLEASANVKAPAGKNDAICHLTSGAGSGALFTTVLDLAPDVDTHVTTHGMWTVSPSQEAHVGMDCGDGVLIGNVSAIYFRVSKFTLEP